MNNKTPDNKSFLDMNNGNRFDIFDSFKKFNSNNNMLFPISNPQNNIQNIKTINATRNNKLDYNNNEYRTSSNSQKKILNFEQESNNEHKLDKINLSDKNIILKTLDDDMLNNFETRLINKLTVGSFEIEEVPQVQQIVRDIPEEIRKYHDLLKDGIITEEEFENKKKELLNS